MSQQITEQDIQSLVGALSDTHKAAIAPQIGRLVRRADLSPADARLAFQMIDRMIDESVETVRKGLAEHIAESPLLPRPMIERLLNDIDSVALPIVRFSTLLEEGDLLQQVGRGDAFDHAVARRPDVTPPVAGRLVQQGGEQAVETLLRNPQAEIAEESIGQAIDRFTDSTGVMGAIAERPKLPLGIAEKLVSLTVAEQCIQSVSDIMMDTLVKRHDLPAVLAEDLLVHGRERSVAEVAKDAGDWSEVEALVKRMHAGGRLSTSLMLRVLAGGDLQFFVAGMGELTRWPRDRVTAAVEAAGVESFRRLYDRSGLEPLLFHAFRVARDEMKASRHADAGGDAFVRRVIERITEEYRSISPAGLEQVLSRLRRKAAESA